MSSNFFRPKIHTIGGRVLHIEALCRDITYRAHVRGCTKFRALFHTIVKADLDGLWVRCSMKMPINKIVVNYVMTAYQQRI